MDIYNYSNGIIASSTNFGLIVNKTKGKNMSEENTIEAETVEPKEVKAKVLRITMTDTISMAADGDDVTFEDLYVMVDAMISAIAQNNDSEKEVIATSLVSMYVARQSLDAQTKETETPSE